MHQEYFYAKIYLKIYGAMDDIMCLFQSTYETKVSFEDLDPMNIVWHGNYMRYLEQARCDLFSKINYTYANIKEDGFAYPVAKMKVKYIKPAFFEDILVIKTSVISIEPALEINYDIYNKKTDEKILEAYTMQILIDIETKQSVYTPPKRLIEKIKGIKNEKN